MANYDVSGSVGGASSLAAGNNFSSYGGLFNGIKNFGQSLGGFMGSKAGQGLFSLAGMGMGMYGMNKSFDLAENQLGILKSQESRAAEAQRLNTGNMLSLARQTTTPGSPERARIDAEIAQQNA